MKREISMQIATTILEQLGGHRFVTMTGAKDILALESGLRFKLPGAGGFTKKGINLVSIILEGMDTYTVKFEKVRGMTRKTIAEFSDIYSDGLQELFTRETGLDTHF